ncbi:hypothetical protein V6N11_013142 [Hibiscus sabdariffa]|uniref:Uncharacterized protein n=2 Tax=Hibiscus sabdariffa TaxID=183260 RepID=A0ABR2AVG4_9ROSI
MTCLLNLSAPIELNISNSKTLAEEVSCEQKVGSIPTGTDSSECPRNMVYEESGSSSDEVFLGNSNDSKSLAEDPKTNPVDANVTVKN